MKRVFIVLLLLSLVVGMTGCLMPHAQHYGTITPRKPNAGDIHTQTTARHKLVTTTTKTEAPTLPSIADVVEKVYPVSSCYKYRSRDSGYLSHATNAKRRWLRLDYR